MPHIQETINLVHLTDIHLGLFRGRRFLERIVKKTNDLNPDLILNTGDLFDGRNQLSRQTLEPLSELEAPHYFIDGNHDEYTGVNEIRELLRNLGVQVLENEVVSTNNINIIGLKYMRADGKTFDMHASLDSGPTIKNTLEALEIPDNKANIILHHSPVGINYAQEAGGNLFLAGHTHGGQIIPFNFFTKLAFPFNRGLYDFKQMKVFVSEGLGTFGPPMRLGTKSEVVMIRLIPEK